MAQCVLSVCMDTVVLRILFDAGGEFYTIPIPPLSLVFRSRSQTKWGGQVVQRCWLNCQCWGVLLF